MQSAKQTLDATFMEMRWRVLSLAADMDRIARSPGGEEVLASDPRLQKLRDALQQVMSTQSDRAAAVQLTFSDLTPGPR